MEKSLLLVVPIDSMLKMFTVGEMFEYNSYLIVNSLNWSFSDIFLSVAFFNSAYDKCPMDPLGSIGEGILRLTCTIILPMAK